MQWFHSKTAVGALALMGVLLAPIRNSAQTPAVVTVLDSSGGALAGITIFDDAGTLLGRTDGAGRLTVPCGGPCRVRVTATGFQEQKAELVQGGLTLHMQPTAGTEQVTVTAYRAPLASLESPVTTSVLTEQALSA